MLAWAVGLVPALILLVGFWIASTNAVVRLAAGLLAATVMHAIAAAVWPQLPGRRRRP
jgi:hypothetical protein